MAIAFDAAASGNNDNNTGVTFALNVVSAANGIIVVNVVVDDPTLGDRTVSSVTWNSRSLTNIAGATVDSSPNRSEIWYLLNTTDTGSHNVVVTMGGTCGGIGAGAMSFTGVDQGSPIDASTAQSGTGSPSKAITTVADNAFIAEGCLINTSSASLAVNSGQTQKWNVLDTTDGIQFAGGYKGPITPAGSNTESWNAGVSSANYVYSLISLTPASAGLSVGEMMAARQFGQLGPIIERKQIVDY
jgi:hypothetical protein